MINYAVILCNYWEGLYTTEGLLLGNWHNQIYILERDSWLHCENEFGRGGVQECGRGDQLGYNCKSNVN